MKNLGFISEAYLKKLIKKTSSNETEVLIGTIKSWFNDIKSEVINNVSTDEFPFDDYLYDFLAPVLSSLNFSYQQLSDNHEIELYSDSSKLRKAGTLYAIRFDENIDSEIKGKNYSFMAVQLAKKRNIQWAFLTNGLKWRLFNTYSNSPYETFLEVDLEGILIEDSFNPKNINAILLNKFFLGKTYFCEGEDNSLIEEYFILSDKEVEKQEKTLKDKMESVVEQICYGFKESIGKDGYTSQEKKDIFEDAIVLLYRILFIQYAESRNLLPLHNQIYKEDSLMYLIEYSSNLFNNGEIPSIAQETTLWRKFDLLRKYVDEGWDEINMAAYNGGLFDNSNRPILRNYSIKNSYFSSVLCELSFIKKAGKYTDKIEYKDLSVRNLGSLYEGLLEFNLFIAEEQLVKRKNAKGQINFIKVSETQLKRNEQLNLIEPGDIYLANDATERKSTGSYYTPEDVVNYIIKNTIGEKLVLIKNDFYRELMTYNEKLHLAITESEQNSVKKEIDTFILDFVNKKILSLSVLDSSMGSGHFLVNATYYIANFIMEVINRTEWVNTEIPANLSYWKSKVVSHCIYGIDINPLAVHLGKLSLWLISAEENKPLSFMDHHLKTGNSLLGLTKNQIQEKIDEWTDSEYTLFTSLYQSSLDSVIEKYESLQRLPENTKEDVHYKKELYEKISYELNILKKKYDLFLSYLVKDGYVDKETFLDKISVDNTDAVFYGIENGEILKEIAENQKFFHWDLEFPHIIFNGGFDVVIGNPPYVVTQETVYKYSSYETLDTKNLFSYMMERGIVYLKEGGGFGVIVPISSVSADTMSSLQRYLINNLSKVNISFYGIRPSKLFPKVEQRLSIIFGKKKISLNQACSVFTTTYLKWFANERKDLFDKIVKYAPCNIVNISNGFIPKLGDEIENSLFEKLKSSPNKLEDVTNEKNGEQILYYHSTPGYWIKCMDYLPKLHSEKHGIVISTKYKPVKFDKQRLQSFFGCIVNSSLFYWWWNVVSDCRDLTKREINNFPINIQNLNDNILNDFENLFEELMINFKSNQTMFHRNLPGSHGLLQIETVDHKASKLIIDKIDKKLSVYYGLTQKEWEFITKFDIRLRMGNEGE